MLLIKRKFIIHIYSFIHFLLQFYQEVTTLRGSIAVMSSASLMSERDIQRINIFVAIAEERSLLCTGFDGWTKDWIV